MEFILSAVEGLQSLLPQTAEVKDLRGIYPELLPKGSLTRHSTMMEKFSAFNWLQAENNIERKEAFALGIPFGYKFLSIPLQLTFNNLRSIIELAKAPQLQAVSL